MSTRPHSLRRLVPFLLLLATACAVPTEPRWERPDGRAAAAAAVASSVARYVVEAAPVTASTEFRSRVIPAVETLVVAPGSGRTVGRLVATGAPVREGEPLLEWSTGVDDATRLRIEILELGVELADLEGRDADAAAARAELADVRASAERVNTTVILSPVDGVVGRYLTERSVEFAVGDELVTVGDPRRTRVEVVVTADAVESLVVGDTLLVVDAQNRFSDPIEAVITEVISPRRSEPGGDTIVTAVLDVTSALAVGTRVIVNVDRRSDRAGLRIATDAVLDDGLGPFLILEDDGGWHRVDIEVGLVTDDFVELITEIPVGATAVVP